MNEKSKTYSETCLSQLKAKQESGSQRKKGWAVTWWAGKATTFPAETTVARGTGMKYLKGKKEITKMKGNEASPW